MEKNSEKNPRHEEGRKTKSKPEDLSPAESRQEHAPGGLRPSIDEDERERVEQSCRSNWLGQDLKERLDQIRRSVIQLFEDHRNSPPLRGFTPHSAIHCQAVEHLIYRLIPEECYKGLREYERYLLLTSAWLHDIGMIRGLFEERDKGLADESIRATHHERSEEFIVNHPARCGVRESDAPILGTLVRLHGSNLDDAPEDLDMDGVKVRVRLIAAYLCLADALHIDATRAPSDLYAICLAYNVPVSTKIHWIKSRFVNGVHIDAKSRQIVLQFKIPSRAQEEKLSKEGVDIRRIARIHDVVIHEVERNLSAVKTELLKGGISYYLTIERKIVRMHLDGQVLRDLKQIINNPDFMANPSSSRLTQLMLRTVADVLNLDDLGEPIEEETSTSTMIERRNRVRELLQDIRDGILRQRPCHVAVKQLINTLEEELKRSLDEIRQVQKSPYKPGLSDWCGRGTPPYGSVEKGTGESPQTEKQSTTSEPAQPTANTTDKHTETEDPLVRTVKRLLKEQKSVRRWVRVVGKRYFRHFLKKINEIEKGKNQAKADCQNGNDKTENACEKEESCLNSLPPLSGQMNKNPKQNCEKEESCLNSLPPSPITVLLFGYSELVVKALTGFRDEILARLLREYLKLQDHWGEGEEEDGQETAASPAAAGRKSKFEPEFGLDLRRPFHKQKLEQMASDYFRIFVCSGEPKNVMASTGQLGFQDAYHYIETLKNHSFTNIIHVADVTAVGNLLHRSREDGETVPGHHDSADHCKDPMVDLVLLGVNGIENQRFRHGTGHLGVAAAVAALSQIYCLPGGGLVRFRRLPRLVFVASRNKIIKPSAEDAQVMSGGQPRRRWTWLEEECTPVEGYWIQKGFNHETVRDKVFVFHDQEMQQHYWQSGIRLYTPREESVWVSLADDLIWEEGFFYGEDRGGPAKDSEKKDGLKRNGLGQNDERWGTTHILSDTQSEKAQKPISEELAQLIKFLMPKEKEDQSNQQQGLGKTDSAPETAGDEIKGTSKDNGEKSREKPRARPDRAK